MVRQSWTGSQCGSFDGKQTRCALQLRRSRRENCQHKGNMITGWLAYNVGRIKNEACSVIADIDNMDYLVVRVVTVVEQGGSRREKNHSAEQCERCEDHGVS